MTHTQLVGHLSERLLETLRGVLPKPGSAVALLDAPLDADVGMNAVWLGTRRSLRRLGLVVPYLCDLWTYSQLDLAERLNGGTILLSGGGSLGDLWPHHQAFRERVIQAFRGHKIVQLPQSIRFSNPAGLKRAKKIFEAHPDFTLLLRDRESYELAQKEFHVRAVLCPDMALGLATLERPQAEARGTILWLKCRERDSESPGAERPAADIQAADWNRDVMSRAKALSLVLRDRRRASQSLKKDFHLLSRNCDELAAERVTRGCRLLAGAEAVITDRVHGHLLSLMLGIPSVCLRDRFGKLRSFYETWTRPSPITAWADTPDEAAALVRAMIPRTACTGPEPEETRAA